MLEAGFVERLLDQVSPAKIGQECAEVRERQLRELIDSWERHKGWTPPWIQDLPAIIRKARAIIEASGPNPGIKITDEYTRTDDFRCTDKDSLDFYEAGDLEGAYHLVICPEMEGGKPDLKHPVLEVRIRPYELWLEKMRGPLAEPAAV